MNGRRRRNSSVAQVALRLAAAIALSGAAHVGQAQAQSAIDLNRVAWDEPVACGEPAPGCGEGVDCAAAVPSPAYGGCCRERTKLTGDWGGRRTAMAAGGMTFDADSTSFYFGNTTGGINQRFSYAGHSDYVMNLDGSKLGLVEGNFVKIKAEHRYGQSINADTGSLMPVTVLADIPAANSEEVYLTNVLFTQFLSETFAVFAGKMDTLDGDLNAFSSGRGKTQFSNMALVANPIALRTVPYSTLGAGFVYMVEGEPIFTGTILNASDTTGTSGFSELFDNGAALMGMLRVPTEFFDLPGHQLVGGTWSSKNFTSLGQDPRIVLPDVPVARASDSWSLFWNADQYLIVDPENPRRGWGPFGRLGIADDHTNPIAWFGSVGVGGSSWFRSRPADTFGLGWYYVDDSSELGPIVEPIFGPISNGNGLELFYNAAITPWCHVTPDLQVIAPGRQELDTCVVAGVRANVDF